MADIVLDEQSAPATPSAGQGALYVDTTASRFIHKDDSGRNWGLNRNWSVADQAPAANTDTYLTGSSLLIPSFGMQAGMRFIWYVAATKTAAATAAAVWTVRTGANQSTADTSRVAITQGVQSAVADQGIAQLMVTVRSVGASGVLRADVAWSGHHASATGFGNGAGAAGAGFDNSAMGGLYIGVSLNTGASAAWTITQIQAELLT